MQYLYGPGRRNEHTDPHLVASWDGFAPDPGRDPQATLAQLRDVLDLHVVRYGPIKKHVYHRMVRADPSDRNLSDEEWADVARRIVAVAGIAPDGDPDGCRWIAVHHGDNHIHILATTVRADLTQARIRGDQFRAETELTEIERQYGLKDLSDTRTPEYRDAIPKRAKSGELRKAERLGQEETGRERLRTGVRRALAGAASEEEFLARLTAQGIQYDIRRKPSGDPSGYTFALAPVSDGEKPVWFSGSKLAADLTLPKIHGRFAVGVDEPPSNRMGDLVWSSTVRYRASTTIDRATATVDDAPWITQVTAVVSGAIEVLDTLALTSPVLSRKEINHAARALEYTAVAGTRAARAEVRAMRSAARELLYGGPSGGSGDEGAAAATVLCSLVLLAIVIAKWHAAQGHQRQAEAADAAAAHLRTAYGRHAGRPVALLDVRGRQLPEPVRDRQEAAVRQALPADQAARVLAEDGWAALAATLAEAEQAGHDSQALLTQVAGQRELASADSPAAVLTWRVRRNSRLPAPAPKATAEERRTRAARSRSATGRTITPAGTAAQPPRPPAPPAPETVRRTR
ncbi:relaxase/mobilization nuclease domain-containing protein [Kitasatospora sp. NPDC052896]|uniref:relaxase/mobilization nuclease domain-containing protein n=1 Tax=Kitasatospora sp. NPDC052896 TaxID=3364061 RepID=UPI0037C5F623